MSGKKHNEKPLYQVSEEIIEKTRACTKNYSCLKYKPLCEIDHSINNRVHFIKCLNNALCPYKISYGSDFICSCPTRKEIYNKYGE